ncbi:radical SAM/SPASM domain-containing protein [Methanospirillum stamsii]|nr:radical SAM/SPASM domain-containing protein [Methanospirillum stamsii]
MKSTFRNIIKKIIINSDIASSPRGAIIEITTRCNLNCRMCPRTLLPGIKDEEMSYDNFKKICEKLPNLKSVALLGRGEALLHHEIDQILAYLNHRRCAIEVTTNGTLLNQQYIHSKKLATITQLNISLDSTDPDIFFNIRGIPLEKITNSFDSLRSLFPKTWIRLQSLIFPETISQLGTFIKYAIENRFNEVNFLLPIQFNAEEHTMTIFENKSIISEIHQLKRYALNNGVIIRATIAENHPRMCFSPWNTLRVALNGDIYPCCYIYNSPGSYWSEHYAGEEVVVDQNKYKMGNLLSQDLSDFWNEKPYRSLRKVVRSTATNKILSEEELQSVRVSGRSCGRFGYCKGCLFRNN